MIGIDMESIKKFRLKRNSRFLTNNFTKNELDYAFSKSRPEIHLCGFFCAKEALLKTIKDNILLNKIEITHDSSGKPRIAIINKKDKFALSLSHSGDYAVAVVENKNEKL